MIGGYRNVSNMGTGQQLREICYYIHVCDTTNIGHITGLARRNGGDKVRKEKGKEIEAVATEAAEILKEHPHLQYRQALALAKESLKHGEKYRKKP